MIIYKNWTKFPEIFLMYWFILKKITYVIDKLYKSKLYIENMNKNIDKF